MKQPPQQSDSIRLIEACKGKELKLIRSILEERPKLINLRDKHERSLLHYIAINLKEEQENVSEEEDEESVQNNINCFNYLSELAEPRLWKQVDLDGLSLLHLAVISCNVQLVRWVLFGHRRSDRDFSQLARLCDKELHSPLHWAVITNNLHCVQLLIKRSGVDLVHLADLNGATALHYATQTSDYPKYRRQLRLMLQNSVNSTTTTTTTTTKDKSEEKDKSRILEFFVELAGVNLECLDNDKRSPLLWAASSGNRDACLLLLSRGANLRCQDLNRLGALHCAASHGFTDCLETLLNAAAEQATTGASGGGGGGGGGDTSVASASLGSLIDQPDNLQCTPLFYAVLSGNIDCLELLLDRGASVDWQDVKGRTAAHFAALKGQLNSLKLLQQHKANLWLANKQGDLPLHYAIKSARQQVVAWLLAESPYERAVNAINNLGRAPIHLAVMKNNQPMAEYLVKMGANLNQLVKVRGVPGKANKSGDGKQITLVNQTGQHQTKSGSTYHYETALDMARRLNHSACLQLLEQNNARSAANVLSLRNKEMAAKSDNKLPPAMGSNVRSVFDLQAAEMASPIGFETSSSSAEPQTTLTKSMDELPKLPLAPVARTVEASIPMSDSTNSSALSQSSLTSVRLNSGQQRAAQPRVPLAQTKVRSGQPERSEQEKKRPFKGGISYHNEHINASIKCKLYGTVDQEDEEAEEGGEAMNNHTNHNSRSFPPLGGQTSHQNHRLGHLKTRSSNSLDRTSANQQEIITNVNVYTSPCSHCFRMGRKHRAECKKCANSKRAHEVDSSCDSSEEDDLRRRHLNSSSSASDEAPREEDHLPPLAATKQVAIGRQPDQQQQQQQARFVAPSRNYEQHLGTILSAEEDNQRSTSGETNANQPIGAGEPSQTPETPPSVAQHTTSTGQEEPRFDRRPMQTPSRFHRQRGHLVKSPVAEYIHSRPIEVYHHNNWQQQQQHQQPVTSSTQYKHTDYSQVKAKVDSHRNDSGLSSSHFLPGDLLDNETDFNFQQQHQQQQRRSKSYNNLSQNQSKGHQQHQQPVSRSPYADEPRSISRQTIIKTRRLSVDSVELASRVEKSIRKYKQETKLFEELQNLKRSQIRSGRANEALLVKRLVEHFKADSSLLGLLDAYHGPYTYQSYELYLYDQLRKVSQSNCAKLAGNVLVAGASHSQQHVANVHQMEDVDVEQDDERNYFEEDLKAELELQRVLNDTNESMMAQPTAATKQQEAPKETTYYVDEVILEPRETLEEIRVREKSATDGPVEQIIGRSSSANSSRRSSVDIEREKLLDLPLQVASKEVTTSSEEARRDELEDQARRLSSAIIVDALGNVSRMSSPTNRQESVEVKPAEQLERPEELKRDEPEEPSGEPQIGGQRRRKSVVNIGDKMETIYHDIGIEIEPVAEGEHDDEAKTDDEQVVSSGLDVASSRDREADDPSEGELEVRGDNSEGEPREETNKTQQEEEEEVSESQPNSERQPMEQIEEESKVEDDEMLGGKSVESDKVNENEKEATGLVGEGHQLSQLDKHKRRLSSPAGSLLKSGQAEADIGPSRRSSYAIGGADLRSGQERYSSGREQEKRKVFNGYDLDKLHSSRTRRADKSTTGDHQGEHSKQEQRPVHSPTTFRRHLERSRPPKRPFRVHVPLEEVRRRWRPIKCSERRKRDSIQRSWSMAKSQPNLIKSMSKKEDEDETFCSNFVLIYEINKDNRGSCWSSGGGQQETSKRAAKQRRGQQIWCQRKMTRIVDVRSLKRTLSLPESLMYSNDLLKRFNILKL